MARDARTEPPRLTRLFWPLGGCLLIISVQAWNASPGAQQEASPASLPNTTDARLTPTAHPAVPPTLEAMWYARGITPPTTGVMADFARGVAMLDEGLTPAIALPLVSAPALAKSDLSNYSRYFAGIALQRLDRLDEADSAFANVVERNPLGQLTEAALYRRAEIRQTRTDFAGAAAMYQQLLARTNASPQIALVRLGVMATAANDTPRAIEAYRRVLREHPLSSEAAEAEKMLESLGGFVFDTPAATNSEFGRAEALFKARRWDQARTAFNRVRDLVQGDERDLVDFRLAQIDAIKGQHRIAREIFRRFTSHPQLAAEAQYEIVSSTRILGEENEFKQLTNDFVARYPTHRLAEEALNELARHYVLTDDDGEAAKIYARMVDQFPTGAFAERATWKAGWWAYREKNFRETIRVFEKGAATFPRSDYRPSWLYWTARAYDQAGDRAAATERYRLTATDYRNSYYGRLAWTQLEQRNEATVTPGIRRVVETPPTPPPTASTIARLIEAGLYRPALNELQYAQKIWGDSPQLQATLALVHNRMGNLRVGITTMRRAYPQFLTAGGEGLPEEILQIIFPIDFWPLLKGNAQAHGLDPFLVTALAAQESTFDPRIRSSANAIGLMQIVPSTGRRYARKVGMRGFTTHSLENPEINARLGTQYFADLVRQFGGAHYALAGYNAGEHRVEQWNEEAPGLPMDEWIDNIPFPETQNYVKRILGTADDYRRLYGESRIPVVSRPAPTAPTKSRVSQNKPTTKKAPAKKAPTKKAATKRSPAKNQ